MRYSFACTFYTKCGELLATFRHLLRGCGLPFKSVHLSSLISVSKAFLSEKTNNSVELI